MNNHNLVSEFWTKKRADAVNKVVNVQKPGWAGLERSWNND